MSINEHRKAIDALDRQIVGLINERAGHAQAIGRAKAGQAAEVFAPGREQQVFDRLSTANPGPLPDTAIWAALYIVPLGAAALFQLRGALWTMAVVTVLYTVREVYGHLAFDNELLPVSISFRMGVGFIIAAFAGAMASGLVSRLRELAGLNRITQTVADERELSRALEAVTAEMLAASGQL